MKHVRRFLAVGALLLAGITVSLAPLACGGATRVTQLPDTAPERGARGPFAATFASYERAGATEEALRADFAATRTSRSAAPGWLGDVLIADGSRAGVVTLWQHRDDARRFHDPTWRASEVERHGAEPILEIIDIPVWIDRGKHAADARVLAFVSVPLPWFRPRGLVEARILARVPEYQALAGLERKLFTIEDAGRVGGFYLWRDRADADAFYDASWHAKIVERYGQDTEVQFFDVLAVVEPPAGRRRAP